MAEDMSTGKVSWNIAASQSQFVFELIKKSINYYQSGNLSRWYWSLSSLREMVNYSLSPGDRKKLDSIEKNIQSSLKYWSKYKQKVEGNSELKFSKDDIYKKNLFSKYVRLYQRELMDLLNKLGYFPSKKDRSQIQF